MPRCPTCHRRLRAGRSCPVDGAIAPDRSAPAVGPAPAVPGFQIGERLGIGGFAAVWAARSAEGREVAVKVGHDAHQLARDRMLREAEILARIGPPWVPELVDRGELADRRIYLVMERLDATLADLLEAAPAPPSLAWVQVASDALLAPLAAVHAAEVVHRDLKPENVFVCESLLVGDHVLGNELTMRLCDFGVAMSPGSGRADPTRSGVALGSVEYMAPEQFRGQPAGPATDLYAFGVMLYELLTLRPPFVGDVATIEHGHGWLRPPRPSQLVAVPAAVEELLLRCLAKPPEDRPPDVASLRKQLAAAWHRESARRTPTTTASSLLVESRQPVVLLVAEGDLGPDRVGAIVTAAGGFVARQRGRRATCVFPGYAAEDPVAAAIGVAAGLTAEAAGRDLAVRCALHLTHAAIKPRRRGPPAVVGAAVDRPDNWLPGEWQGTVVTAALAQTRPDRQLAPAASVAEAERSSFFVPRSHAAIHETSLHGREEVLARARRIFDDCVASATPGLLTVLGEAGIGKTRLAEELAAAVPDWRPQTEVIALVATQPDAESRLIAALDLAAITPRVVVIDDGHRLGAAALDRIEEATLDRPATPLLVAVIADRRLTGARQRWGRVANHSELIELGPLDAAATCALAAELLLPAEYSPAKLLARLADWSGGNPQTLTALIAELKRQGMVRPGQGGDGWLVATAEIERLPADPAWQWLATRALAEMTPELAACVRLCAVLGDRFTAAELHFVADAVDREGGAGTPVDPVMALGELVTRGHIEDHGGGWFGFLRPGFRAALYQLLDPTDCARIHGHAADYLGSRRHGLAEREQFARHVTHSGRHREAAEELATLADEASQVGDHSAADRLYSVALREAEAAGLTSLPGRLLAGRGRARYRLHRAAEATADLEAARTRAEAAGELATTIDLLLEEAMVADSAANFDRAAQLCDRATELISTATNADPRLVARCVLATGRSAWRRGEISTALLQLDRAAQLASAADDPETIIVAQLLLAPALVCAGDLDRAERVFEEVVKRCQRSGDQLHECAAYGNRLYLWSARNQTDAAVADLRRAIALARELGNPEPERVATHNLAELLFWAGRTEEALPLAQRSRVLQQRFWREVPNDALLLARIQAARGEVSAASDALAWIDEHCDPAQFEPAVAIGYAAVKAWLSAAAGQADDSWESLETRARAELAAEELLEVLWWRIQAALLDAAWEDARQTLDRARELLDSAPIWRSWVEQSATRLDSLHHRT